MRLCLPVFALLLGVALAVSPPVCAKETHVPKKAQVPFREDSGLISAEYYISVGKYSQALSVIEGVLSRHPECADAYTYRGFVYYNLGDKQKAAADYRRAIAISSTHMGANRYLADIYLDQGDLQRAYEQMQVLRMVCGAAPCEELDELEGRINAYRRGQVEPEPEEEAVDAEKPEKGRLNR